MPARHGGGGGFLKALGLDKKSKKYKQKGNKIAPDSEGLKGSVH